jgi:hypothetical protein
MVGRSHSDEVVRVIVAGPVILVMHMLRRLPRHLLEDETLFTDLAWVSRRP